MSSRITRRRLLRGSVAVSVASAVLPARLVRAYQANEKVSVGVIGSGGRGGANLRGVAEAGANIAALCDVDRHRLQASSGQFPAASTYTDYRKLLESEKGLDAVVVSTPDHHHATASIPAMQQGLHCYCEKPLTWSVDEARRMAEVAAEKNLATHMGTGAMSSEGVIRTAEVVRAGGLGQITEAHIWTNRPIWPQGFDTPPGEDPVPDHLDWQCWIGPAPMRPFKNHWPEGHPVYTELPPPRRRPQVYHPFVWRGWWDFGTGALGDIAPHAWHVAYFSLELDAPDAVEVVDASGLMTDMFPLATTIRFDFPARGDRPAVKLFWYDGGMRPSSELAGIANVPESGHLLVGTRGKLGTGNLSPNDPPFASIPRTLRRPGNIHADWLAGITQNDPSRPSCPFSYGGPLTEAYLLGNIALKTGKRLEWDAAGRRFTNHADANAFLTRDYRPGWGV